MQWIITIKHRQAARGGVAGFVPYTTQEPVWCIECGHVAAQCRRGKGWRLRGSSSHILTGSVQRCTTISLTVLQFLRSAIRTTRTLLQPRTLPARCMPGRTGKNESRCKTTIECSAKQGHEARRFRVHIVYVCLRRYRSSCGWRGSSELNLLKSILI